MQIIHALHGAGVLSEEEVDTILRKVGWSHIVDAISETFIEEAEGRTNSPGKIIMHIDGVDHDYRVMPSYMDKYPQYCGTKIVCGCPNNPSKYGLPFIMASYILNNALTQETLLLFEAANTTAYRTAAATAVAVRELAHRVPRVLGIIGCGLQAGYHIEAICATQKKIHTILLYDIRQENIDKLLDEYSDLPVRQGRRLSIFEESDVVVTLTPTIEPHIFADDMPDRGMLICGVGGDSDTKMEISEEVLPLVDHYCDSYAQASHTGTIIKAAEKKLLKLNKLKSLGDLMTGRVKKKRKKVKLFLSTGVALEDLAIARLLHENLSIIGG